MLLNQLGRLNHDELKRLCVPIERCLSVTIGQINLSRLEELESHQFDQAPVYDESEKKIIGIVTTKRLRSLYDSGDFILDGDAEICNHEQFFRVGSSAEVVEILEKMSRHRAVLLIEECAEEDGAVECIGLLTISDLNRQPLRSALYALLAELESGMASLVEGYYNQDNNSPVWLKYLNEEYQVQVLGYWELTKRNGVAIGPSAALTLTQLIQILGRDRDMVSRLGYASKSQFEDITGKIPRLRNCVMHPVRPLVLSQEDVRKVLTTIRHVCDLYMHLEACKPIDRRRHVPLQSC